MRYLLDTHIWLWSLLEPSKLDEDIIQILENKENELFISPITIWETLILAEKGRKCLCHFPLRSKAGALNFRMKTLHPADRFIAATACDNDLILITEDGKLNQSKQIKLLKRSRKGD